MQDRIYPEAAFITISLGCQSFVKNGSNALYTHRIVNQLLPGMVWTQLRPAWTGRIRSLWTPKRKFPKAVPQSARQNSRRNSLTNRSGSDLAPFFTLKTSPPSGVFT
jgi:hypothetical protein